MRKSNLYVFDRPSKPQLNAFELYALYIKILQNPYQQSIAFWGLSNLLTSNADHSTNGSTTETGTSMNRTIPMMNEKYKYMSRIERQLAKIAQYIALGYSIENLCRDLVQMLAALSPHARETAIKKMEQFNLTKEPIIGNIIKNYYQKKTSITENRQLLLPKPKFNSKSVPEEQFTPSSSLLF